MRKFKIFITAFSFVAIIMLILSPKECTDGVIKGLVICGKIIIPSLFPFTVCVLFLMKSNLCYYFGGITKFTKPIFGQNAIMFCTMILSFIGGYPIGARLISELCKGELLSKENARIMLCYCVNAGPGFIVIAVGSGILGSKNIGIILFLSHITASIIIAIILKKHLKIENEAMRFPKFTSITDSFVESVADSASSVIGICSYIILFSAINNYIIKFSRSFAPLRYFLYVSEVTTAIIESKNVYLISSLLGFGGLCVWCQVISNVKRQKIKIDFMIISRFVHALLSTFLTFILLKLIPISTDVFTNLKVFEFTPFFSTPTIAISLITMTIVFIISLFSKNRGGNLFNDVV